MLIVGDILSGAVGQTGRECYTTASYALDDPVGGPFSSTMWAAGREMLGAVGMDEQTAPPTPLTEIPFRELAEALPTSSEWIDGICLVAVRMLRGSSTATLRQWHREQHGVFCAEWLPWVEIQHILLFDKFGDSVVPSIYKSSLADGRTRIGDVVRWMHIADTHMAFQALKDGVAVMKPSSFCKSHLTELIGLILINYPGLVFESARTDEVRLVPPNMDHPYVLEIQHSTPQQATLTIVGEFEQRHFPLQSKIQLLGAVQQSIESTSVVIDFHPHPKMDRLVCLWAGSRRWECSRKKVKSRVALKRNATGTAMLTQREAAWRAENRIIHAAFASVLWKQLRRWIGLDAWGERLLYRLKTRGINCFDRTQQRTGCPHATCVGRTDVTLSHIFWDCPAAAAIWSTFIDRWSQLGHPANLQQPSTCFTFHLTAVPPAILGRQEDELFWTPTPEQDAITLQLHPAAAACWRLGVLMMLRVVWKWRTAHFHDDQMVMESKYLALLRSRLREGYRTIQAAYHDTGRARPDIAAIHVVVGALNGLWDPHYMELGGSTCRYFFFDGGSRGNPGPGGSGAVIMRTSQESTAGQVIWIASMSYISGKTTNNQAEYRGLLTGLRYAYRERIRPLHVVGDSQLIIQQQRRRISPKANHLCRLYQSCRVLADKCGVRSWTHHYRSFNKTADASANLAMNTTHSRQVVLDTLNGSEGIRQIVTDHAGGDLRHWLDGQSHDEQ